MKKTLTLEGSEVERYEALVKRFDDEVQKKVDSHPKPESTATEITKLILLILMFASFWIAVFWVTYQ